nr:hypothetical protein [Candidatus Cloacimonadota bacterium]
MKTPLIQNQHLYLKLAIFVLGISTAFEASFRQLGLQSLLVLIYMSLDWTLYAKLIFALRKLVSFLAAYWLLALFTGISFPDSLLFSAMIIYLIMITVATWGALDLTRLAAQISWCKRYTFSRHVVSYFISTYLYIQEYFRQYKNLPKTESIAGITDRVIQASRNVHQHTHQIEQQTESILTEDYPTPEPAVSANLCGMIFLSLLVLLSNI